MTWRCDKTNTNDKTEKQQGVQPVTQQNLGSNDIQGGSNIPQNAITAGRHVTNNTHDTDDSRI